MRASIAILRYAALPGARPCKAKFHDAEGRIGRRLRRRHAPLPEDIDARSTRAKPARAMPNASAIRCASRYIDEYHMMGRLLRIAAV